MPALEAADISGVLRGNFGDEGIFAGVGFQFLELQLQLVEEAAGVFSAGAVLLALQLGDQCVTGALPGEGVGNLGFNCVRPCRCCPGESQPFIIGWQGGIGGDQRGE
ncbi:hypothetical protein GCM10007973_03310 [Polymorphobacter multimanifer]|nr:hypothetical protein GCM10007973_03310 [Polymorphobacter multimanifer]